MKTDAGGFVNSLWRFFSSLKLTIFLLMGLAAVSIIGTVIPQGAPPPAEYLHTISQAKYQFYDKLGFFDMYHSWWFVLLLYLLCMNLVACSLRRLPHDWKNLTRPPTVLDEALEKSLPLSTLWKFKGDVPDQEQKIARFLQREFAAPTVTRVDKEIHIFAQKGRYSRLGVYVLHSSIIVVFIGAIIGSLFGYKAFVEIPEGESTTTVVDRSSGKTIDLGFTVRCDSFSVSYYDTGAPREFRSVLSVSDGGRTVVDRRPVIVNRPLTYQGITFYQNSYSQAGPPTFHFTVKERLTGKASRIAVRLGERASLSNGDSLQPLEYVPEIRPIFSQVSGPAVRVALIPKVGEPRSILLLQRYPDFDVQRGGDLVFTYDSIDETWKTGLQVAKDPGVWVVWLGCFLMVGGIFMAFFMSHRRIWIRIGDGRAVMAGNAVKNLAAFKVLFDGMAEKLKKL